ncbi:hypothetical protein ABW636_04880 [Aquimarina sp. 2201CG1-2-11]|uniref:hypothetical protein n=1 Tax=Aquimarina discodermiae TaxID=3231043 RepID=UPI003463377A
MSNTISEKNAFALKDILVSLADGLSDAQEELNNQAPFDDLGRPNTIYQLPYLDFKLQVVTEFEQEEVIATEKTMKGALRFTPAKSISNDSDRIGIFSTISGRFVATVPNEGLPKTELEVDVSEITGTVNGLYSVNVITTLQNAVGERISNKTVSFNVDETATQEINGDKLEAISEFYFDPAEIKTDKQGNASTTIKFSLAPKTGVANNDDTTQPDNSDDPTSNEQPSNSSDTADTNNITDSALSAPPIPVTKPLPQNDNDDTSEIVPINDTFGANFSNDNLDELILPEEDTDHINVSENVVPFSSTPEYVFIVFEVSSDLEYKTISLQIPLT